MGVGPESEPACGVREVYLDHHATTPLDPRVTAGWSQEPESLGHPDASHYAARRSRRLIGRASQRICQLVGGQASGRVLFFGSASEAIRQLHQCLRRWLPDLAALAPASSHRAVLNAIDSIEAGARLAVNSEGLPEPLEATSGVPFCSAHVDGGRPLILTLSLTNSEVGAAELAQVTRFREALAEWPAPVLLHIDACQGLGYIDIAADAMGASFVTLSGHKVYGPTGVAALYARCPAQDLRGGAVHLGPEFAADLLVKGTPNLYGVMGLDIALGILETSGADEAVRLDALRRELLGQLRSALGSDRVVLNGPPFGPMRHPGNLNVSLLGIPSAQSLVALDVARVAVTSAAACSRNAGSHVLRAMSVNSERSSSALRFGLGRGNTEADVGRAVEVLSALARGTLY